MADAVKHTPGPWEISSQNGDPEESFRGIIGPTLTNSRGHDYRLYVAQYCLPENASLIAAAPDLLFELKSVQQQCLFGDEDGGIGVSEDVVIPSDMFDRICAAIRKAEGAA